MANKKEVWFDSNGDECDDELHALVSDVNIARRKMRSEEPDLEKFKRGAAPELVK